jgi:hypothetical protein
MDSLQLHLNTSSEQLLLNHELPGPTVPEILFWKGDEFIREDHALNRRRDTKQSTAWDHGHQYALMTNPDVKAWRCALCLDIMKLHKGAAATAVRHLRRKHKVGIKKPTQRLILQAADENEMDISDEGGQSEGEASFTQSSREASQATTQSQGSIKTLAFAVNLKAYRYYLLRWVIEDHIAFNSIESESFRKMMEATNPSIKPYLVQRKTLRNWVDIEFGKAKAEVKGLLANSLSRIHVSFDLWTSPNQYAICAVVAHFVRKRHQGPHNQSVLLAMKRMRESHSGENVAGILCSVLQEYDLVPKLGVFIADNAESNDVAIRSVLRQLRPDLKDFDSRRSRCIGHVINLAAKAFIFGQDVKAFEADVEGVDDSVPIESDKMKKAQQAWRLKGPIGKLHNIIVFIRSSPQRREAFKKCVIGDERVDGLNVIQDNCTRWNSHYASIGRALDLQERLFLFSIRFKDELGEDLLSEDDWSHLKLLFDALYPFNDATQILQSHAGSGHHGSIWEFIPTIEALMKEMEQGIGDQKAQGQATSPIAIAYQNAWEKLQKYYKLTDNAHTLYAAATIFSPATRQSYFDQHWTTTAMTRWKEKVMKKVRLEWEINYRNTMPDIQEAVVRRPNLLEKHLGRVPVEGDQFQQYAIGMPTAFVSETDVDLLLWWDRSAFHQLRQMAFDLLSIPAMSAEVERVFSSAKRLVTPERSSLSDESIEVTELLRYWWVREIVQQSH